MIGAADVASLPAWKRRFPALAYPNFRLWMGARVAWAFAMVSQGTTTSFLAYEQTHSTAFLGYVSLAYGLPILTLTLFAGVVADRTSRRRLVLFTQACWMLPVALLAALVLLGALQPTAFIIVSLISGTIYAFDNPARGAFVPSLLDRQDLTNASMLDHTVFYLVSAVTPAIAGFVYTGAGPAACLLLSLVSYALCLGIQLLMKLAPEAPHAVGRSLATHDLREGLAYAASQQVPRTLLLIVGTLTFFGLSLGTLLPAWAVAVFNGNAATYGVMQSVYGIGMLASSVGIALLGRFSYKGKLLTAAAFVTPVVTMLFAVTPRLGPSLVLLFVVGLASTPVLMLAAVLLQILVPDALRGRVMSMFTLMNFGMQMFGGLFLGVAAQSLGVQITVLVSGLILLGMACAVFLFAPSIRALE